MSDSNETLQNDNDFDAESFESDSKADAYAVFALIMIAVCTMIYFVS